jgi:translation initiation factor IF-2
MATRASSKKDPSAKAAPKADSPAGNAPAAPATDLISTTRKKAPTETRKTSRSAVPPISKANQPSPPPPPPVPAPSVPPAPLAAQPPVAPLPKPETVSLIDDNRSKRAAEEPSSEVKQKSVLPPISKIRAPVMPKAAVPPVQVVRPEPAPAVTVEPPAPPGATGEDKVIHIKPPIIVRELAQQIGLKPFQLIHDLMDMNIFAAINHTIEPDIASAICKKHGYTFEVEKREKGAGVHTRPVIVEEPPPPVI